MKEIYALLIFTGLFAYCASGQVMLSHTDIIAQAQECINREEYTRAAELLAPVLADTPADGQANFLMGQTSEGLEDYEKAIGYYLVAAQSGEEYYDAYFNVAYLSFELTKYEDARANYEQYLTYFPNDAGAHYNLGVVYNALGQYQKSIDCYENALLADPKYYNALYNLAIAYYDRGELDRSVHYWNRLLEINREDADAYYGLGLAYYDLTDYYTAADAFRAGSLLSPDDGRFFYQLGRCYYSVYKYDEAIAGFSRALELNYMPEENAYYLGFIFADINDYTQAQYYMLKAAELGGDIARPHMELALLYRRTGNYGQALDELYIAKRFNFEDMPMLLNLLGQTYIDLGQYDMAAQFLRQSINEDTNYTEAHFNLAVALEQLDREKAAQQWERYINLASGVPGEKYSLIKARKRLRTLRNGIK